MKFLICLLLISLTAGCGITDSYSDSAEAEEVAAMVDAAPLYVNQTCPVMGGDVGENPEVLDYNGVGVAICCEGCGGKWEAMAADEKDAFVSKWQSLGEASIE